MFVPVNTLSTEDQLRVFRAVALVHSDIPPEVSERYTSIVQVFISQGIPPDELTDLALKQILADTAAEQEEIQQILAERGETKGE